MVSKPGSSAKPSKPKSRQPPTSGDMSKTGVACFTYCWLPASQLHTYTLPSFSQTNNLCPFNEGAAPTGWFHPEPIFEIEKPAGNVCACKKLKEFKPNPARRIKQNFFISQLVYSKNQLAISYNYLQIQLQISD